MKKFLKATCFMVLLFMEWGMAQTVEDAQQKEFSVRNGEISISGSLFFPGNGQEKVPVLLFIPGSSSETRETFMPFVKPITDFGCAVVIYDKRGTGKSTGNFIKISSKTSKELINERANDVSAIVDFLKAENGIDSSKIGACASSQGTWVAHAIQRKTKSLGFLMYTSGGVASVGESDFYDETMDDESISIEEGNTIVTSFSGYHGFNPKPDLQDINIPTVFIYGALDRSHPILYDISVLEKMNKPNFKIHLLPNVNHNLIDVTTCQFSGEVMNKAFEWMGSILN